MRRSVTVKAEMWVSKRTGRYLLDDGAYRVLSLRMGRVLFTTDGGRVPATITVRWDDRRKSKKGGRRG